LFGALDLARIAPLYSEVGDGELVVGPKQDGALERGESLRWPAERSQRMSHVVPCARVRRLERNHALARGTRALRLAGLSPHNAEAMMRSGKVALQVHRAFVAGDRGGGRSTRFLDLRKAEMRQRVAR